MAPSRKQGGVFWGKFNTVGVVLVWRLTDLGNKFKYVSLLYNVVFKVFKIAALFLGADINL